MNRKNLPVIIILLWLCTSCVREETALPEQKLEQFIHVFTGYLRACMADTARDEERTRYLNEQLALYNMTLEEFEQIRNRLEANPNNFRALLEKSDDILEKIPRDSAQVLLKAARAGSARLKMP